MSFDNLIKITTLAISVIVTINSFSKLEKNTKLSDDYFQNVLSVYAKKYKCNININPLNFIKRKFDLSDYFIPSYIFYLVDKGEKEKLHKILMVDYNEKFPSKTNSIFNGIYNISTLAIFILLFIYCIFTTVVVISGGLLVICLIFDIIFSGKIDINYIRGIGISILICIITISFILVSRNFIEDDYTMKIKYIEKIIKRKVRIFDKDKNNYYLS